MMKILHYIQQNCRRRFVIVKRIINLKTQIMKKILKFSLVVVALVMAMNVSASENNFSLDVKKGQGKTVNFALSESNKVVLSIYDLEGKLIHKENVDGKGVINRTYKLDALPVGTYFLFAESDAKVMKYEIVVAGDTAVLSSTPVSEVYKPVFAVADGLVSIRVANEKRTPVNIHIYNEGNEMVYSGAVANETKIEKLFDINKAPYEKYTFIVSYDGDKVFEKTVSAK